MNRNQLAHEAARSMAFGLPVRLTLTNGTSYRTVIRARTTEGPPSYGLLLHLDGESQPVALASVRKIEAAL